MTSWNFAENEIAESITLYAGWTDASTTPNPGESEQPGTGNSGDQGTTPGTGTDPQPGTGDDTVPGTTTPGTGGNAGVVSPPTPPSGGTVVPPTPGTDEPGTPPTEPTDPATPPDTPPTGTDQGGTGGQPGSSGTESAAPGTSTEDPTTSNPVPSDSGTTTPSEGIPGTIPPVSPPGTEPPGTPTQPAQYPEQTLPSQPAQPAVPPALPDTTTGSNNAGNAASNYSVNVVAGTGITAVRGGGTYSQGTLVTVNATVATGYTWKMWTSDNSTLLSNGVTATYSFTMPAGNVTLTASAIPAQFTISFRAGQYCSLSGTANHFMAYSDKLVPERGYPLPTTLTAKMNGLPFKAFTYNNRNGTISIGANVILGDIEFSSVFSITYDPAQHGEITGSFPMLSFSAYDGTLTPTVGYSLPKKLTATMYGNAFTAFTYDQTTGKISIAASETASDIVLKGKCTLDQFSVTYEAGQHGAITGTTTANYLTEYSDVLVPDEGYALPETLTATMQNSDTGNYEVFSDFTYEKTTGAITIASGKILGDIVFTGACEIGRYSVTYQAGQRASITGTSTANYVSEYNDTLVAEAGHVLPNALAAQMDGNSFTSFTYDNATGAIHIAAKRIAGDIVFTGVYSVTYDPAQHGSIAGTMSADFFDDYSDTLTPDVGYQLPQTLTATMA